MYHIFVILSKEKRQGFVPAFSSYFMDFRIGLLSLSIDLPDGETVFLLSSSNFLYFLL
jgi:hypothetical protein